MSIDSTADYKTVYRKMQRESGFIAYSDQRTQTGVTQIPPSWNFVGDDMPFLCFHL
jgi:hypothetical protein